MVCVWASLVFMGCAERSDVAAPPKEAARRPTHVDSILPRLEALRRFQAGSREVDTLEGGASSRDALIDQFVRAVETRDMVALGRLALNRDEFAFLYYPTAPQGLPPYELAPDLLWFLLQSNGEKGLARTRESLGSRPLGFVGYRCDPRPSREGVNLVWGPCVLRWRRGNQTGDARLFGLIIERAGRFKFVDYGSRL